MRVYNFNPGPATLPEEVLRQAQEELLDYRGSGISVMEMSHRSPLFQEIAASAEERLRRLMAIPDDYHCLFLQGGATGQFAAVPMNLLGGRRKACYLITGNWSKKAAKEAEKYGEVVISASSEADRFTTIPPVQRWEVDPSAAYLHYTPNETIHGVEFHFVPEVELPLVADMSSNICSRPIDISRFGLIYAGAQKNLGPAGITVVIVRKDLLERPPFKELPSVLDYRKQAEAGSMLNTPPTYNWYLVGLVLEWIERQGGLAEMERRSRIRSEMLYRTIDGSDFYHNPVDPACRSRMNVPFRLADESLNGRFLEEAREAGLVGLKGHRAVGGMRASLYNAMPIEGVERLVEFMRDFENRYG